MPPKPIARLFLERRAIGLNRRLKPRRSALQLANGPERVAEISKAARYEAMALAKEKTGWSSNRLAIAFGVDHTTILYGIREQAIRAKEASLDA